MKKTLLIAAMLFAAATSFAQPRFAHVNFQELVTLMPEADQARATLSAAQKEAQETGQAMIDEFNSKYQAYQQKVSTMTAAVRETKEKELTDLQQRIQQFEQSFQQDLQQQQNALMAPIYNKAKETVNALAKDGGFVYVFDVTSLLYFDAEQSTDLTPAARKALDIPEDRTIESLQAELQAQAQAEQAQ